MDLLAVTGLISAAVGAVAAMLWIVSAVRGRQFSRPRLQVAIGLPSDFKLSRAIRRVPLTTLLIGSPSSVKPNIVGIPIFLKNTSDIPITDVSLRIEYSSAHLITDGLCLFENSREKVVLKADVARSKREFVTALGTAHVSWDVGMLRPHDTAVVNEFISLHPLTDSSKTDGGWRDPRTVLASKRFAGLNGFQAFFVLNIVARSSNCAPLATSLNVIWSTANSLSALCTQAGQYALSAWNRKKPKPGLYFDPLRPIRLFLPSRWTKWTKFSEIVSEERFSLIFLKDEYDPLAVTPQTLAERVLAANVGVVVVYTPPWGLTGEEFDLEMQLVKREKKP